MNRLQINEVLDRGDVPSLEVGQGHTPALAFEPWGIQFALDRLHDRGSARAAVTGLVFHAVPVEGIVAGGDHHTASGPEVLHRVGKRRSRRVIVREAYGDSRASQNLRDDFGGALRDRKSVV